MSNLVRRSHRWLAVIFTVTVIVTAIMLAQENPILWVSYVPLLPLALMFISGAYLFVQPYLAKRRHATGK